MSCPLATNTKWNGSMDELLNIFTGFVDQDVIEAVIDYRNNDLLMAYEDLLEIAQPSDSQQSVSFLSDEKKNQSDTVIGLTKPKCLNWERLSQNETPTKRILYLVSNGYKVMVVMRGCSGSGKSYKANNILSQCYKNANDDEFIFGSDKYFINKHTGHYKFNRFKLSSAHSWNYENALKAVQREVTPVIIDNTNTQIWEMEKYVKLAVNNGYWIEIIEPTSEWAWDEMELFKRNQHSVPMDSIMLMLNRYDHIANVDELLTTLKLKYSKINQPPKLSNCPLKYQLCDDIIDEIEVANKPSNEINDNLKAMQISQKLDDENVNKQQYSSIDNNDENPWIGMMKEKEILINDELSKNTSRDISDVDEENEYFTPSSSEGISNVSHKSVNTDENDFLFLEVLNEIPEEEYSSYVVFGQNRNINEGNKNISSIPCGHLDKSTTTNDLRKVMYKPNVYELCKQFPEDLSLLINELFDKCEGNIDWIVDMLFESGHNVTKQKLLNIFQTENNSFVDGIQVEDTVENCQPADVPIKQNEDTLSYPNSPKIIETFITNKTALETEGKKKKHGKKVIDSKKKNLPTIDDDLRKNFENKFVFDDSLYSEHVLKIKKLKDNPSLLNFSDNPLSPTVSESVEEELILNKSDKEKFVQLVVDTSVLTQLCDYFGDFSSGLNKNTLPMSIKLPEKLAEDLYYCLIANVPSNIFDQEAILQDETLAKKLQEDCKKEWPSSISNTNLGEFTFAAVLSKKLLLEKFKNLDPKFVLSVLRENEFKFQEASDVLSNASGIKSSTTQNSLDIIDNDESYIDEEKYDQSNSNKTSVQETLEHAQIKQHYLNKANQSISTKMHPAVTGYYLEKAEESKQNEKHAKTQALMDMVKSNGNATTLDLHFFQVQEAVIILDLYLDNHISNLKKFNSGFSRGRQLTIITGRGKHSPKGIARIRPVIVRRLQFRRIMYMEPETPGLVMVIIKKTSFLSSEL